MKKNRSIHLWSSILATWLVTGSSLAFAESPPMFPSPIPTPDAHLQQERQRIASMKWRLVSIRKNGNAPVTSFRAGLPTNRVQLTLKQGRVSVQGTCNQISGVVRVVPPKRLIAGNMATTRKMCGNRQLTQADREMTRYLRKLSSYTMSGNRLNLVTNNRIQLNFVGTPTTIPRPRPTPTPLQPNASNQDVQSIRSMNWQLNALIKKGEQPRYRLLSGQSTRTINMTLENNRFVVNAGCNSMFSGATFTPPHRVKVGRMGSTMKGCPAIQAKTEQELSRYFPGFQTYWLSGNRLNLVMRDQTTLQFTGKPKNQGHAAANVTTRFIEIQYKGGMKRWREAKYLENGVRTNNNEPWRRGLPVIEGFAPQRNMQYVVRIKQYYDPRARKNRWVKDRVTMNGVL